jgi:hypothetical protein
VVDPTPGRSSSAISGFGSGGLSADAARVTAFGGTRRGPEPGEISARERGGGTLNGGPERTYFVASAAANGSPVSRWYTVV